MDLESKLKRYQAYINEQRTHTGIEASTPAIKGGATPSPVASLDAHLKTRLRHRRVVIGIHKEAQELADSKKVAYPVLSDQYNIVAKRWAINKLPCVYVLDGSGAVVLAKVGNKGNILRSLLDAVRLTLDEPLNAPVPEALAHWVE